MSREKLEFLNVILTRKMVLITIYEFNKTTSVSSVSYQKDKNKNFSSLKVLVYFVKYSIILLLHHDGGWL